MAGGSHATSTSTNHLGRRSSQAFTLEAFQQLQLDADEEARQQQSDADAALLYQDQLREEEAAAAAAAADAARALKAQSEAEQLEKHCQELQRHEEEAAAAAASALQACTEAEESEQRAQEQQRRVEEQEAAGRVQQQVELEPPQRLKQEANPDTEVLLALQSPHQAAECGDHEAAFTNGISRLPPKPSCEPICPLLLQPTLPGEV